MSITFGVDDVVRLENPTTLNNIFDTGGSYVAWIRKVDSGAGGNGRIIEKGTGNTAASATR